MSKAERWVIVDGSWLVFRAFYAIPANLSTRDGTPTNAVFGFATMFRKLFAGKAPDRGAIVFDAPAQTFREAKFPDYKAQRPSMPDDLRVQLALIDRLVRTYGFPVIRVPGYEADDVVATLARMGAERGAEVVMVAGDKDLAQVVTDRVRMHDTMRDVIYDPELVRKKWGVPPTSIADYLALVGDTVDNIPGVPGIGAKGAAQLLADHGSLDGILANVESLKGKTKAALLEHREAVKLYRELATVDPHVPFAEISKSLGHETSEVDLSLLAIATPESAPIEALHRELEFFSLLGTGEKAKAREAVDVAAELVTDDARAHAIATELGAGSTRHVYVLGSTVDAPVFAKPIAVGIARDEGPVYVIGLAPSGPLAGSVTPATLARLLGDAGELTFHDAKSALEVLETLGEGGRAIATSLEARGAVVFDTMLASFLIDPEKCIPHRLDQLAKEYAQRTVPELKTLVGSGQSERALVDVEADAVVRYVAELTDVVRALRAVLAPRLESASQRAHYEGVELPLSHVLRRMEITGIGIDANDLEVLGVELRARKAEIEARIYSLAGREFNIGSTKQLADVLFEELKLPVIKKTKTGYSTDAEVLERLAPKHEIAREILSQRELAKLINTYTDVLRAAVRPETGRIHARFQQTTGVSGRLISTDPDLQRTPVRTPEGKRIRRAFVAPPGRTVLSADWSQIELRVLAHFSKDERLLEAFRENLDLHRRTAAILFEVSPEAVTKEQRGVGKTVNFATIYGQGATALGQILGIPRKDAQRYIEQYFEHYSGVRRWLDQTIEDAHRDGFVTTILGRRRIIAELASRNETDRATGERIAANTPIQGSAADLCKLAMLAIDRALPTVAPSARLLLQVHDELVFDVLDAEVEAAMSTIRAAMEKPYPLDVPLVVEVGRGASWGEAH